MNSKLLLPLIFFIVSCSTYSEQELNEFDQSIIKYTSNKKIKLSRTDSGLYLKINTQGTGRLIQYGDSVSISYAGELLNGKLVDIQKKPISFAVKDLIMGWKEALIMAKKGSEMTLIIPPSLGYGNHELEQIPKNSIIKYDLKVWDVK